MMIDVLLLVVIYPCLAVYGMIDGVRELRRRGCRWVSRQLHQMGYP